MLDSIENTSVNEKNVLFQFIANNHELEVLESKLNVFNPFSILGIENYEIRHSNVLAWLLDPRENHGFGDSILKKILAQILLHNEHLEDKSTNVLNIHLADLNDATVAREEFNIDILVVSKRHKLVLLIENKINAKESLISLINI